MIQHFLQVACFGTTTSVANIACKYGKLLGANINRVDHILCLCSLIGRTSDVQSLCAGSNPAVDTKFSCMLYD